MLGACSYYLDSPQVSKEALINVIDTSSRIESLDDMRKLQVLHAGHLLALTYVKVGQLALARSTCDSAL